MLPATAISTTAGLVIAVPVVDDWMSFLLLRENERSAPTGAVLFANVTVSLLVSPMLTTPPLGFWVALENNKSPEPLPLLTERAAPPAVPSAVMFPPVAVSVTSGLAMD